MDIPFPKDLNDQVLEYCSVVVSVLLLVPTQAALTTGLIPVGFWQARLLLATAAGFDATDQFVGGLVRVDLSFEGDVICTSCV